MRQVLPPASLDVSNDSVATNSDVITADVIILLATSCDDFEEAVAHFYHNDFLADSQFSHEELVAWCEGWRTRVKLAVAEGLTVAINKRSAANDWEAVLRLTRRQLEVSPYDEDAAAKHAQALVALGNMAAAAEFLRAFRQRYRDALDVDPTLPAPTEILAGKPRTTIALGDTVPFVGRHGEVQLIKTLMRRSSQGTLESVLLSGAPGSGKTRLAVHALRWAAITGTSGLYVDCRRSERLVPYGSLNRILELIKPGHLRDAVSPVDRLSDALSTASGAQPIALCVDDVQWMDASTSDVLGIVADRLRQNPIFVILTARAGELRGSSPADWRWVTEEIHLQGLASSEIGGLIAAFEQRSARPLLSAHREWIKMNLAGNPFFIVETLRYLTASEGPVTQVPVPPTIKRVLRAQIAGLRPHSRRLLACSAVFGTQAAARDVFAAARLPTWKLLEALDELTSTGVMTFAGDQLAIRHELLREAVYGDTPPHVRRLIHAKAAVALNNSGAGRASEVVRHQYHAKKYRKAFVTCLGAAESAIASGGFAEAESFIRLALRTAGSREDRNRALSIYLDFLCDQRRFVEALRPCRALRRSPDLSAEVKIATTLARCAIEIQKGARPISEIGQRLEQSARLAARRGLVPRLRDSIVLLAEAAQHNGRVDRAQYWADQFLNMAEDYLDYHVEVRGLAATLAALAGDAHAAELGVKAVAIAEGSGKPRLIALARSYSASANLLRGNIDRALADYDIAIDCARRAGMRDVLFLAEGNSAVALIEKGEFTAARARLERCLKYGRRGHAFQHANLAILGVESADWDLAVRSAETLMAMYGSYHVPWIPVAAHTCLGLAAVHAGDIQSAWKNVMIVQALLNSAGGALSDRSYPEILLARYRNAIGDIWTAVDGLGSAELQLRNSQPLASLRVRLELNATGTRASRPDTQSLQAIVLEAEQRGAALIASRARSLITR